MSAPEPAPRSPSIDAGRLLARVAQLAAIGATADGGVTREAYGELDVRARSMAAEWMLDAGLEPVVDAAANLIGRRRGRGGSRPWLAVGSHLDTVVDAGSLDGAYGVLAGIEVADALGRSGVELHHELTVVAFANEEGARGSDGMAGSRALVGELATEELESADDEGVPLASRLEEAGGDPAAIAGASWLDAPPAAFLELHIEQGPVLDGEGRDAGVVTAITGRQGVDIEIRGAANHAGTTPMDLRRDALVAAAEVVLAVEALATDGIVRVATCGHLKVQPNVRNVVPGHVKLSAELRAEDAETLLAARPVLESATAAVAARRRLDVAVTWSQYVAPVAAHPTIVESIGRAAERSGLAWRSLPSGAGHDAQIIGHAVPIGMIFVPSIGGISHSPRERTEPAHLVIGAQLLLDSVIELDRSLAADATPVGVP